MDESDFPPIAAGGGNTSLASLAHGKSPRCVFCGMDASAKFGQGELLRFRTTRTPLGFPDWYSEPKSQNQSQKRSVSRKSSQTASENPVLSTSLPLTPADHLVGDHCALDACRRLQEGKILEPDGKPVLSGLPNAYSDAEGRPFGFVDELREIGWPASSEGGEKMQLENLLVACAPREGGEGSWLYAHHCCASWSDGVVMNKQMAFEGVEEAAVKAVQTECALCRRIGASVSCHAKGCQRSFHFPCAAGAGCYQEIKTLTIYCPSHLDQVIPSLGNNVTPCLVCDQTNDVPEMIYCTSCGSHFHNPCLEPPLTLSATVRVGWQCPECKTCLICNESKDETKMVICDVCDKGFHTYCLKPPVTSIPRNGFKCERCRICTDCGLRRFSFSQGFGAPPEAEPADQPNVKWHANYTLCDRCFHTRKRQNACCAVCDRAWRCCVTPSGSGATTPLMWPSRRCSGCRRMVHHDCDPTGQSSLSSPHSSSSPSLGGMGAGTGADDATGGSQSVSATAAGPGYLCPSCRNRGSNTPSEPPRKGKKITVLSATASLRTSPFIGGAGSSDLGDANSIVASASPSLTDDQQQVSSSASVTLATRASVANSNADSTSTTPTTDPGKQTSAEAHLVAPSVPPKSPRSGASGTRSQKTSTVGRPPGSLTKSKSVSASMGEMGRKRASKADHSNDAWKPPSRMSTNSPMTPNPYSASTSATKPQVAKTVGAKRSLSNAMANPSSSSSNSRARRSKNRKTGAAKPPEKTESKTSQEKDDHPSTVVICRSDDRFVLEQDMCVTCGSFGDPESLIACAQCGQCFHCYCADVSHISRTMLEKGWRCLDCTICEGCGQTTDENLLLLCDECDISYHTFCLNPPLKEVPKGGWKCSNCVSCQQCGSRSPGVNGQWYANYTQCAPCASLSICPACTLCYRDGELLVKCALCARWSHAGCDQLRTEDEIDFVVDLGYNCTLCREHGASYGQGHQQLRAYRAANGNSAPFPPPQHLDSMFPDRLPSCPSLLGFGSAGSSTARSDEEQDSPEPMHFFMDGVVLNRNGLNTIRRAMLKGQPKKPAPAPRQRNAHTPLSATPDTHSAMDTAPPSVYTPADEEASQQSGADADSEFTSAIYGEMAKSPRSIISEEDGGAHGLAGIAGGIAPGGDATSSTAGAHAADGMATPSITQMNAPTVGKKSKANNAAARRHLNLGVGGFRARPSRAYQTKKSQLAAAAAAAAGSKLPLDAVAGGKKRRPNKRKSDLEENYPDYLMQAFYGDVLLSAASSDTNALSAAMTTPKKRRRKPTLSTSGAGGIPGLGGPSRSRTVSAASNDHSQHGFGDAAAFRKSVDILGRPSQSKLASPRSGFASPTGGARQLLQQQLSQQQQQQHNWSIGGPSGIGSPFREEDFFEDMEDFGEDGETVDSFDEDVREDIDDDVFNIQPAVTPAPAAIGGTAGRLPQQQQQHEQSVATSQSQQQQQPPQQMAVPGEQNSVAAQMQASLDEVNDYMVVDDFLNIFSSTGRDVASAIATTTSSAAVTTPPAQGASMTATGGVANITPATISAASFNSTGSNSETTPSALKQRLSAAPSQGPLPLGAFADQPGLTADQKPCGIDLPPGAISAAGADFQRPQSRPIFPEEGPNLASPRSQDQQAGPSQQQQSIISPPQGAADSLLLPELSVLDIESLIEFEAPAGSGSGGGSLGLPSDGGVASPSLPPSQPDLPAGTPGSVKPGPSAEASPSLAPPPTPQPPSAATPFPSNAGEAMMPSYQHQQDRQTPQPPPQYPPQARGMMPQPRQAFYQQQQQQQPQQQPGAYADPSVGQSAGPPPPPPYPGSRQGQVPMGWRPPVPQPGQPQPQQRYPQQQPQFPSQAAYMAAQQQQQQQQQRFQAAAAAYRGMSPGMMQQPQQSGPMSPKARQSPFPSGVYDQAGMMPEGGIVPGQQLKSMLRQDMSPRRPGDIPGMRPGGMTPSSMMPGGSTPIPASGSGGSGGNASASRRINYEKWEDDERLGDRSTIAPILYANVNHPELRTQWPDFRARAREINKLWRRLPAENRAQFVNQARTNRTQLRANSTALSPRGGGMHPHHTHPMMMMSAGNTPMPHTPGSSTPMPPFGSASTPGPYLPPGTPGSTPGGRSSGGLVEQGRSNTPISPGFVPQSPNMRHAQSFPPMQRQQTPLTPHHYPQQGQLPPHAASPQVPQSPLPRAPSQMSDQQSLQQRHMEADQHPMAMTPASHMSDGSSHPPPSMEPPPPQSAMTPGHRPSSVAAGTTTPSGEDSQQPMPQPLDAAGVFHQRQLQQQQQYHSHPPPSVAASQPSPSSSSLSPSSLLGGVMRRGGPTSLPPPPTHAEPPSPAPPPAATPQSHASSPYQHPQQAMPSTSQHPHSSSGGTPDQSMQTSQQQQQQGAYLPPPSKPPPPPPTWTPSGYTQGVNSPVLPRWSPGTIPGTQGPASPATGSHHHQQQLFYQHQRQQQQQQEMLHHPMPSPRPYPPPSASQLMQQAPTPMPQHYGMDRGGLHHQQQQPSPAPQQQQQGNPVVETERQKLLEILAKKVNMKKQAQAQAQQQQLLQQQQQQQQQSMSVAGATPPTPSGPSSSSAAASYQQQQQQHYQQMAPHQQSPNTQPMSVPPPTAQQMQMYQQQQQQQPGQQTPYHYPAAASPYGRGPPPMPQQAPPSNTFFPGSPAPGPQQQPQPPPQHSGPPSVAPSGAAFTSGGVFARSSPSPFESQQQTTPGGTYGTSNRPASHSSTSAVQSPACGPATSTSASPPVVAAASPAPASASSMPTGPSLCSPPVLPATTPSHPPQSNPPPTYPVSAGQALMDPGNVRSPFTAPQQQQPSTPVKSSTPSSAASGLEDPGFEPPVILSRVVGGAVGKERPRFMPHQHQQPHQLMEGHEAPQSVPMFPQRMAQHPAQPQYEMDFRYHQPSSAEMPQRQAPIPQQQLFYSQPHRQSPAGMPPQQAPQQGTSLLDDALSAEVPVSSVGYSNPSGGTGETSSAAYADSAQFLISESQPYPGGSMQAPGIYARARQPGMYAGRPDYPMSVPPPQSHQPSGMYEQAPPQAGGGAGGGYMQPQTPQYTYNMPPQSPYPSQMRRYDDQPPHPGNMQQ